MRLLTVVLAEKSAEPANSTVSKKRGLLRRPRVLVPGALEVPMNVNMLYDA
jgi:hypothetical protein